MLKFIARKILYPLFREVMILHAKASGMRVLRKGKAGYLSCDNNSVAAPATPVTPE